MEEIQYFDEHLRLTVCYFSLYNFSYFLFGFQLRGSGPDFDILLNYLCTERMLYMYMTSLQFSCLFQKVHIQCKLLDSLDSTINI